MKYLQNRNQFLNKKINIESSDIPKYIGGSKLIKETFENDVTWGGSLLGRFINSVIRRSTIYYKALSIPRLLKQLESELLGLVTDASVNEEDKNKIKSIQTRLLIEKVYNIVVGKEDINKKLTQLIGDGESDDQGALNESINEVEKLEEDVFPRKEELLTKLKEFRDLLRDEDFEVVGEDEDEEDDENEEVDDEGTSDKDEEGEGGRLDDTQEKFLEQTMKFFKSIMDLSKVIESKIIQIEGSKKTDIQVGKEYTHTNKKGESKPVKVVSLTNVIGLGTDKQWYTKDDIEKSSIPKDFVFVIFKDPKGGYSSASPQRSVSKSSLSELSAKSLRDNYSYRNEFLPMFEDNLIRSGETQAIATWKKILKAYSDSGMSKAFMNIQKIVEKKSGLSDKEIISLTSNVILNENTIGKPLKFEDLVKEDYNLVDPKYNSIPKSVSLFIKVITPLKEDKGLVGSFGAASQPINGILESYSLLKGMYPKLPKLTSNKKKVDSKKEDDKKEEGTLKKGDDLARRRSGQDVKSGPDQSARRRLAKESLIQDFNKFRLFEAVDKELDEVTSAWFQIFEDGEEKEYSIDTESAKELQEKIDNKTKEPFAVSEKHYDRIIRIIRIFAKAYKKYATDYIPSGRPEGRISLATFREYRYVGDDSNVPEWKAESNPGLGPWAAKVVFDKWDEGVMEILEKPELREVLANARFIPKGVEKLGAGTTGNQGKGYGGGDEQEYEKIVRAGRSLFDFINDLVAGEGEFRKIRKKIMKEYFQGADSLGKDDDLEKMFSKGNQKEAKEKSGANEVDTIAFYQVGQFGIKNNTINSKELIRDRGSLDRTFFKFKVKESGNSLYFVGQFMDFQDGKIFFKFEQSKDGASNMIPKYLGDEIEPKGQYKIDTVIKQKNGLPYFVGSIESQNIFGGSRSINLKVHDISKPFKKEDIETRKLEISNIFILGRYTEEGKYELIQKKKPDSLLSKDMRYDELRTKMGDF